MTGVGLFILSRRWIVVVLISAITAALVFGVGQTMYSLTPRASYMIAVAGQLPVIPAIAIQATLQAGLHQQESTTSRGLRRWRLAHIAVLTLIAAVFLWIACSAAATTWTGIDPANTTAIVRNLLALVGASLIGASLFGSLFAWTLPVAWLIVPYLLFNRASDDPTGILTLTGQDGVAFVPFAFACGIWAIGMGLAASDVRVSHQWT